MRGGARPGGGRKPGVATKVDRELRERALKGAKETPLEYMLRIMADETAPNSRRDTMSIAAAPYLHAKLSNVSVTGAGGGPLQVRILRLSEAEKEDQLASEAEANKLASDAAVVPQIAHDAAHDEPGET